MLSSRLNYSVNNSQCDMWTFTSLQPGTPQFRKVGVCRDDASLELIGRLFPHAHYGLHNRTFTVASYTASGVHCMYYIRVASGTHT